jgi:hypothetical protein
MCSARDSPPRARSPRRRPRGCSQAQPPRPQSPNRSRPQSCNACKSAAPATPAVPAAVLAAAAERSRRAHKSAAPAVPKSAAPAKLQRPQIRRANNASKSAAPTTPANPLPSNAPPPSRSPNSWASPAPWPHTMRQPAKFSPPPAHYASPTPSPPMFGYLHSRFSGETAPMSIPQAGGGRGPMHQHHRNLSEPSRAFMFPPPSPKNLRGEAGRQESPTETNRSFKRADGIRMGDLYANLSSGYKVILLHFVHIKTR